MKIALSPIFESEDYIQKFLERVDDDVARLPSNDAVLSTVSTLGQVLKLTKTIMDQFSQVRYQCLCPWTLVNRLIMVIRYIRYSTRLGRWFPVSIR